MGKYVHECVALQLISPKSAPFYYPLWSQQIPERGRWKGTEALDGGTVNAQQMPADHFTVFRPQKNVRTNAAPNSLFFLPPCENISCSWRFLSPKHFSSFSLWSWELTGIIHSPGGSSELAYIQEPHIVLRALIIPENTLSSGHGTTHTHTRTKWQRGNPESKLSWWTVLAAAIQHVSEKLYPRSVLLCYLTSLQTHSCTETHTFRNLRNTHNEHILFPFHCLFLTAYNVKMVL